MSVGQIGYFILVSSVQCYKCFELTAELLLWFRNLKYGLDIWPVSCSLIKTSHCLWPRWAYWLMLNTAFTYIIRLGATSSCFSYKRTWGSAWNSNILFMISHSVSLACLFGLLQLFFFCVFPKNRPKMHLLKKRPVKVNAVKNTKIYKIQKNVSNTPQAVSHPFTSSHYQSVNCPQVQGSWYSSKG